MAYMTMLYQRNYKGGAWTEWTGVTTWVIEDPYSRRRCGLQGCKRLIGHPERQVEAGLHADFDVTLAERPGTFSMWPVKASSWGTPYRAAGATRGVAWP